MNNSESLVHHPAGRQQRKLLFDMYARNLEWLKRQPGVQITPDIEDIFLCPLCFRYFTREEALGVRVEDAPITIEHVPPRALGGNRRTLTCKECNNHAGHGLESHLLHQLELLDFFQSVPGAFVDAQIHLDAHTVMTARVHVVAQGHLSIQFDPKRSPPKTVETFVEETAKSPHVITVKTRGRRGRIHKPHRSEYALLRIAFLMGFSVFGYGFLLNDNLRDALTQIREPETEISANWTVVQQSRFPEEALGINIITSPKALQSMLFVFDLNTELRSIQHAVVLPGPTSNTVQMQNAIAESATIPGGIQISYTPVQIRSEFLQKTELGLAFHSIWNTHIGP